jgi:hypothetical protein
MFHPGLGRWANIDPIGFTAGDVNLYRTVGNNPITGLDPSGLEEITDAKAFGEILKTLGIDNTPANRGSVFEIITQLSVAKEGGLQSNTGLGDGQQYVASPTKIDLIIPKSLEGKKNAILKGAVGNAVPDLWGDIDFGKKVIASKMVFVDSKATDANITLSTGTPAYQPVKYIAKLVENAKLFGTEAGASDVLGKGNDRLGGVLLFVTYQKTEVSAEVASLAAANGVTVFRSLVDYDKAKCEFYVKKATAVGAGEGVGMRAKTLTPDVGYVPFTQKGVTVGKDAIVKGFKAKGTK